MISKVDSYPKMPDLMHMIIHNVFLISQTFAHESNVFLSWAYTQANLKNQYNCWVCGQLPTPSNSGLPWRISLLQGTDKVALRKFTLEERCCSSVLSTIDITRRDPFTQPVNHTCSKHGHKYEFSLKVTQAQSEQ